MSIVLLTGVAGSERARAGVVCDLLNVQVLEQSGSRTIVQLSWPDDDRVPTPARFALAVPDANGASVQVLSRRVRALASPERVPQEQVASELVRVDRPGKFREQWVSSVSVFPVVRPEGAAAVDTDRVVEITLQFSHPSRVSTAAGARTPFAETASPLYEGLVINPAAAAAFRSAEEAEVAKRQRAPIFDLFENSSRWLRIEVRDTGLYRVGHSILGALGIDADLIDPDSFRLFAAPHPYQPRLPEDPAGSWQADYGLRERPLLVEADDETLKPGDAVFFYATGPEEWSDRYDTQADSLAHLEHEYADRLAYWLTWDELTSTNTFPGEPLRMASVSGQPGGGAARTVVDHSERLHLEQNTTMLYGAVEDNWVWERRLERDRPRSFAFDVQDLIADSLATYTSVGVARGLGQGLPAVEIWFNDDPRHTPLTWSFGVQDIYPRAPAVITAPALGLREGLNLLTIQNISEIRIIQDVPRSYTIIFDFFTLTYRRHLRLRGGELPFVVFEGEVAQTEVWEFEVQGQTDEFSAPFRVLDTRDPLAPRVVTGVQKNAGNDRLRFEAEMTPDTRHHFLVVTDEGLQTPVGLEVRRPRRLRAEVRGPGDTATGYDMVVLHPDELRGAAERLADFRTQVLPDRAPGARVTAVDLRDVYDQFGHGVKDPAAIRNYLKFLYELDPRLEFVALVGDASRDYRNRSGRDESASEIDRCPTFVQTQWPRIYTHPSAIPYAADDWLGAMDNPPPRTSTSNAFIDLPDLAMGRLPAGSPAEANLLVDRILAYEQPPESALGPWRNVVLMVADDEVGLASGDLAETEHVDEAECVAEFLLPKAFEVDKLYLTEFPVIPNTRAKPKARETLRQKWSAGSLVVHYIGHGSPEQLADEAVFRIEDVASLRNDDRLPLFLAFSCDVAIFDDPAAKSMTEQLVLEPAGGAVAGIAATQVTYVTQNENLTETFYAFLYPDSLLDRSAPVGRALMQAKVNAPGNRDDFDQHNNQKYHLLGDPSLRLQSPRETVAMSGSLADSIQSGRVQSLHARIEGDGFGMERGKYFLMARESTDSTLFRKLIINDAVDPPETVAVEIPYVLPGATFFNGTGTFAEGELDASLQSPRFLELGEHGRVRVLMGSGSDMLVAADGTVPVRRTSIDSDDEQGPSINLTFENDASQVTPGMVLTAVLEDPSGINVLGTLPANSILLEQDKSGFPVDVTALFSLDDGEFTRGELQYELPQEISPGRHTLALRVSDMLENSAEAEIGFNVIPTGGAQISGHSVFPNPFRDRARFVVEITSATGSDVELTIHTTDGRTIQRLRQSGVQGKTVLEWDGRDLRGDEVANGVYLYTVRASFQTERAFTEVSTGRIVRMR